jgi:hypothetical protein
MNGIYFDAMSVKLSVERDFDTLGEFEASTEGDEST